MRASSRSDPRSAELTVREREVLRLMARGMSNTEIAATLIIGESTVKTHVARILMKLDLSRRAEVAAFMARRRRGGDAQDWS